MVGGDARLHVRKGHADPRLKLTRHTARGRVDNECARIKWNLNMTKPQPVSRAARTSAQILEQQKKDADRARAARTAAPAAAKPPANNGSRTVSVAAGTAVPAVYPDRTPSEEYLDEISPMSTCVGRPVKFNGQEAKFLYDDTAEEISPDTDFLALCGETLVGHIRFHADGSPPDTVMGLLYEGFKPDREALGDLNEADWPAGLSGQPEDPWRHQVCLVLQTPGTCELATFRTMNPTGRAAVGRLLRYYERLIKKHPDHVPIVRLKKGGYNDKKYGRGWIDTPVFVVVGKALPESTTIPDSSRAADFDDNIPDFTK
jgi:hypothetical protein